MTSGQCGDSEAGNTGTEQRRGYEGKSEADAKAAHALCLAHELVPQRSSGVAYRLQELEPVNVAGVDLIPQLSYRKRGRERRSRDRV